MLMSTRFCSVYQREQGFANRDIFSGPISPEYSGEFIFPFTFSFAQTFAQLVEDGAVADFSLAIALRIIG